VTAPYLLTPALGKGVPLRITIDGVVYERLIGADGAWLTGADGLPLYGRI
jgi:hypothetical protein